MKVLFTPRDDNPYQRELAAELAALGVTVEFLPERTPSHTLNVLLMPLELLIGRARGFRVLHVHWVYRFAVPGHAHVPGLRRVARYWFGLVLGAARLFGFRVVWTAHNVLPHTPVFDDDVAGRRRLLEAADAVIVHAEPTLTSLRAMGPLPALTAAIPQGPVQEAGEGSGDRRVDLGIPPHVRCIGMVGRLEEYKGVRELVATFGEMTTDRLRLLLAGQCPDSELRHWLESRAAEDHRIVLDLGRIPDDLFGATLRTLDVSVLPFRSITNSGSALAALAADVPLLLPDDQSLRELPDFAVHRYSSLVDGLAWVRDARPEQLGNLADGARMAIADRTWSSAARATHGVYAAATGSPGATPFNLEAAS